MLRLLASLCLAFACTLGHATVYTPPAGTYVTLTPGTNLGVRGGIPTTRTTIVNVTASPYFADKTGVSDATTAINSAIAAAPANSIVYFPAGTYRCNSTIIANTNVKNITLRGDGWGFAGGAISKLDLRGGYGLWIGGDPSWGGYGAGNGVAINSGGTAGSTTVTVASGGGTAFVTGYMAYITVPNDPTITVVDTQGRTAVKQIYVTITGTSGNNITFAPALAKALVAGSTMTSTVIANQTGIGIESLLLDSSTAGTTTTNVFWNGPNVDCWMKDVKMIGQTNYGVYWLYNVFSEMRLCYVDGGGVTGTNHSGVLVEKSTSFWAEDNIVVASFPNWEINYSTAISAFSYNYSDGDVGNYCFDLNHGAHNNFMLVEGNAASKAGADGYFGSVEAITFYRNWFYSTVNGSQVSDVLNLRRFTYSSNQVGNIIQRPGFTWTNDGVTAHLGYPNIGNNSFNGSADNRSATTVDMIGGVVRLWPGTLTTRTSATSGVVTVGAGKGAEIQAHKTASLSNGILLAGQYLTLGTIAGDTVTFSGFSGTLPTAGSAMTFAPSQDGFQNIDTGVAASLTRKGNYYYYSGDIPAGESLGGQTLADSFLYASKPSWFGSLAWPPFDPNAPGTPAVTLIPAGYRYVNGSNPTGLPLPNPSTISGTSAAATTITVVATTTTGGTGAIQYNHAINGTYQGLQASPSRTFTGLTPSTSYAFKVKAQDSATIPNTTTESAVSNVSTTGTVPTLSSAAIPSAGTTTVLTLSASCTTGAGGIGGVTASASGGALTLTYSSGSGSGTYTFTNSRTVLSTETVTLSYAQPGNGIEATTGGADLASFTGRAVTNNSTQIAATVPTVSLITIPAAGTTTVLTLSQSATVGAGGSGGFTAVASGGALTLAYASGSPGTAYTLTNSRTVNAGETVQVTYVQPGNGIEGTAGGLDLASFSGRSVLNNSTAGIPTTTPTPPAPDRQPKPKKNGNR